MLGRKMEDGKEVDGISKTIWMTASQKLFEGMEKEILNFNKNIQVWTIKKLRAKRKARPAAKQVLLVTYNIFVNKKYRKTFRRWIGKDFDGCVSCSFINHLTKCYATSND